MELPTANSQENSGKKIFKIRRLPSMNHTNTSEADSRLTNPDDIIALLEKLAALHSKGILTDEEYIDKKRDLLDRL